MRPCSSVVCSTAIFLTLAAGIVMVAASSTGCSTTRWPTFSLFESSGSDRSSGMDSPDSISEAVGSGVAGDFSGGSWLTSMSEAQAESLETGKPILADFTGSDWCGYCIKLDDEVFATREFETWARDRFVLLRIDSPRRSSLAPELEQQNRELKERYQITSYPTVLMLDSGGGVLGRTGYVSGGPDAWISSVERAMH